MTHPQEWKEEDNCLVKEFSFKNFSTAMQFVNKVAALAETANHHPDISIHSYNKVKISLTTHDAGKVTEKDKQLADRIDKEYN
jgi:4a-hydroxytetrahydrobiopterin dehydratase